MDCRIELDFGTFTLQAALFDTRVAGALAAALPRTVPLTYWGDEAYGPLGLDLGTEAPRPEIPPGGIAYTNQGHYLCLFFGQTPAWPVEYVGQIDGETWRALAAAHPAPGRVTVRRV